MGDVFWGLHTPIAARLAEVCGLRFAVETGTYFGFGALQLSSLFERVWTIDADADLVEFVRSSYRQIGNVDFLAGDSGDLMPEVVSALQAPALFVLDAHWFPQSPRAGYVPSDTCPLIRELDALHARPEISSRSAIMIDDARMLVSVRKPWERAAFPSISSVLELLYPNHDYVTVIDDVIVAGPEASEGAVRDYVAASDSLGFP
jgi:hypothetical protein